MRVIGSNDDADSLIGLLGRGVHGDVPLLRAALDGSLGGLHHVVPRAPGDRLAKADPRAKGEAGHHAHVGTLDYRDMSEHYLLL